MSAEKYSVIRSDRRTLSIECGADLEILVRAPRALPIGEIERILRENAGRIEKWRAERQRINAADDKRAAPADEEELRALTARARKLLPEKVEKWSRIMGVFPRAVKITRARTRHGSCSAKGNICFSCLLLRYPDELIDFVVVHELAHLKYLNHDPAFHAFVRSFLPEEALLQKRIAELDRRGYMR